MSKLIDKDLVVRVLIEIDELEKEYQACQGLILTETDLQADLFSSGYSGDIDQCIPKMSS